MTVSMQGFNKQVATFQRAAKSDGTGYTADVGALVKLSANGTVTDCANGDNFIGVCVGVDGDHCAVQLCGYVRVKLASTGAPTALGYGYLAADGTGCVKELSTGREVLVLEIDGEEGALLL